MKHPIPTPDDIASGGEELTLERAFHLSVLSALANSIAKTGAHKTKAMLTARGWNAEVWDIKNNQGFVLGSDKAVVVTFGGSNQFSDWWKNAQAFFPQKHKLGGNVHNGFTKVLNQALENALKLPPDTTPPLYLTGHSLGGAVTTGFFAHLLAEGNPWADRARAVTFGTPRLGNKKFELEYENRTEKRQWFFANSQDPVTKLPGKILGYRHVGELHYFTKDNELRTPPPYWVGLESLDPEKRDLGQDARLEWEAEEKAMPGANTEAEFEQLTRRIEEDIGDPSEGISITEDGEIEIAPPPAQLQGDGAWYGARHFIATYIENIYRVLNP